MIGARSIRRLRDLVWRWLLRQAHLNPWRSGSVVVVLVMLLSGLFGWLMGALQASVVTWLDNAFIVLGGLSLALGWAFALVLRARQQEAALTFRRAGDEAQCPAFQAAVILVSHSVALHQWHLRHMPHERVEFIWTDHTRAAAAEMLEVFPEIACLHGPKTTAEEPLLDAFDLTTVKAHCRTILTEILARYPPEQVCVDVTGGTAVMSVGAFQVAEELGVTSLYLLGVHRDQNKPPQIRREHVDDRSEGRIMILSDHRAEPSETSADDAASPGSSAQ